MAIPDRTRLTGLTHIFHFAGKRSDPSFRFFVFGKKPPQKKVLANGAAGLFRNEIEIWKRNAQTEFAGRKMGNSTKTVSTERIHEKPKAAEKAESSGMRDFFKISRRFKQKAPEYAALGALLRLAKGTVRFARPEWCQRKIARAPQRAMGQAKSSAVCRAPQRGRRIQAKSPVMRRSPHCILNGVPLHVSGKVEVVR